MDKVFYYIYKTLNVIIFLIGAGTLGVLIKEKIVLLIIATIYTYLFFGAEDYKNHKEKLNM